MTTKQLLPPSYFGLALVVMLLLHFLVPGVRFIFLPYKLAGLFLVVAGVIFNVWSSKTFDRIETTVRPFEKPSHLITSGLYRVSRNPMYLGMVIVLSGVAILLGSLTPWLIIPVFVWLIDRRFICVEEEALEKQFGSAFQVYKSKVRRWV